MSSDLCYAADFADHVDDRLRSGWTADAAAADDSVVFDARDLDVDLGNMPGRAGGIYDLCDTCRLFRAIGRVGGQQLAKA